MKIDHKMGLGLVAWALISSGTWADTYTIDPAHAEIAFSIRHLGINNVRGHFNDFEGSIDYKGDIEDLEARCTIKTASIDTGIKKRDNHLRSEDFFDVEKHPEIIFESTGVEQQGGKQQGGKHVLKGTLMMHGVSKEIELDIDVSGPIDSPFESGVKIIGLHGITTLNRKDFGIAPSGLMDNLIGDEVKIEINVEAKK